MGPSAAVFAEDYKQNQYYRGIAARFTVTQEIEADIDGSGDSQLLVCYREPSDSGSQDGGILILAKSASGYVVAWHAFFEGFYPKKVIPGTRELTLELVPSGSEGNKTINKTLVKGKDFFFRGEEGSPFSGVKVKASSTLKKEGIRPENVFDRDLSTSWAEGAEGTGVDESITLEFSKPVNLGLIGVLHGNYRGKRYWMENNRIHRAEVTVETESDRYDVESDVDFESDLGLGMYGDRVELSFSNKPLMSYFRMDKKKILSVELKITSVLLGEKNDDAYISEIDFAELIPKAKILGSAEDSDKSPPKNAPAKTEEKQKEDSWTKDSEW